MRGRFLSERADQLKHAEDILGVDADIVYEPPRDEPIVVFSDPEFIGKRDRRQFGGYSAFRNRSGALRRLRDQGHVIMYGPITKPEVIDTPYESDLAEVDDTATAPTSFSPEELAAQDGLFAALRERRHSAAQAVGEELANLSEIFGPSPAPNEI